MATLATSILYDSSSDANFRSWGSAFNAIVTVGGFWAQTADTGQINWTTVLHPAGANTFQGFEIYKSQDSLSTTFPIFMRIDYGAGSGTPLNAAIKITFGTGTNGAGTLTGNVSSIMTISSATAGQGATPISVFSSGGGSRFAMLLWDGPFSNIESLVAIERSLDASGAYTSGYFTYLIIGPGVSFAQQSILNPASGSTFTSLTGAFTIFMGGTSAASGSNATWFPIFPFVGFADNNLTVLGFMKSGDAVEGSNLTITIYGTAHNYIFSSRAPIGAGTGLSSYGVTMRYE